MWINYPADWGAIHNARLWKSEWQKKGNNVCLKTKEKCSPVFNTVWVAYAYIEPMD